MSVRHNRLTDSPPAIRVKTLLARVVLRRPYWETRNDLDFKHIDMLLAWTLRPNSNCVDVGAHRGDVLRSMQEVAPNGRHMAIEPLPALAEQLRVTFPGVEIHEVALSDKERSGSFVSVDSHPALSGLLERPWASETTSHSIDVRVTTLDALVPEERQCDLIKIEVEGGEEGVLRGAVRTIRRWKPVVVFECEVDASAVYGSTADSIHALLDSLDYRVFTIDGEGPLGVDDFRSVLDGRRVWSFVATDCS